MFFLILVLGGIFWDIEVFFNIVRVVMMMKIIDKDIGGK